MASIAGAVFAFSALRKGALDSLNASAASTARTLARNLLRELVEAARLRGLGSPLAPESWRRRPPRRGSVEPGGRNSAVRGETAATVGSPARSRAATARGTLGRAAAAGDNP